MRSIVVIFDAQQTVVFWDSGAEGAFGLPHAEAIGRRVGDLFGACAFPTMGGVLPENFQWAGRAVVVRKDGVSVTIEGTIGATSHHAGGGKSLFVLRAVDIERAERTAAETSRLALIAERIPHAVIVTDPKGHVEWVNPAFVKTTGYSLSEVVGRIPGRVLQGELTDPSTIHHIRMQIALQRRFEVEIVNYRKDGSPYWAQIVADPVFDAAGNLSRYVAIHTDISEKKRAETKIAQQASLLDQAQDAIVVCDLERRVSFWSRGCERIYGWAAAEAVGRPIEQLIYRATERLFEARECVFKTGSWSGEMEQVTREGEPLIVEARWNVLRDEAGRPVGVMAVNTDVTARRRMEEQIHRSQRLESVGRLASGIAHDFNNLLQPIFSGVGFLKETNTDPAMAGILNDMETSSVRSAALVRQLLLFARGEQVERSAFDVRGAVQELHASIVTAFPSNIQFRPTVDPDVEHVYGDPTQIQQVLLNLCVNARDAMPEGGQIDLAVRSVHFTNKEALAHDLIKGGHYVQIAVRDTGTGMPPDVQKRVFEPFFTTKPKGSGTGLGLATVASIVRSHNGAILVQSELGKGSVFTVYLPQFSGRTTQTTGADVPMPRGNGECILIIDDEAAVVASARKILEHHGYRVVCAANGPEAIDAYRRFAGEVSLVICDMAMPGMDGVEVLHQLRKLNPDVRAISASGFHEVEHDGETFFLPKPYSLRSLLTAVQSTIAASR